MNTEPHYETLACVGTHCAVHMVDEPSGEEYCLECGHSWLTSADLLADFNRVAIDNDSPVATQAQDVWICPFCTHDL